jgi:carboxymethylenebutenolidase
MTGKMVQFAATVGSDGYLALLSSGRGPCIIVLQEWWGLVDHIKQVADRFARGVCGTGTGHVSRQEDNKP